jgi:hypothetical protein
MSDLYISGNVSQVDSNGRYIKKFWRRRMADGYHQGSEDKADGISMATF